MIEPLPSNRAGDAVSSTVELIEEDPDRLHVNVESPIADTPIELPVTVIQPTHGWQVVNLRELWRYRELLLILTWRDIKVRYKQTALGAAWAIIQPLATMLVFSMFFGRVTDMPTGGVAYPLFVFTGLLPWYFFANAISSAAQSVVGNQNLVTKIYFPRLLIPLGAIGPCLVDLGIGFGVLLVMMPCYGATPGLGVFAVPLLIACLAVAVLGIGAMLAALTVAYRDFRYVVPFMVQLWMFATPTVYMQADAVVGPRGHLLLPLNPAYGLILNFRQALLGGQFDWYALGVSAVVSIFLLAVGCLYFRRVERTFADVI